MKRWITAEDRAMALRVAIGASAPRTESNIDRITADAIRRAMAQARAEALEEAALIAERGDDIAERIRALAKPEGQTP